LSVIYFVTPGCYGFSLGLLVAQSFGFFPTFVMVSDMITVQKPDLGQISPQNPAFCQYFAFFRLHHLADYYTFFHIDTTSFSTTQTGTP